MTAIFFSVTDPNARVRSSPLRDQPAARNTMVNYADARLWGAGLLITTC